MSAMCAISAVEHAIAELASTPTALAGVPQGPSPARRPVSLPRYGPVSGPGPLGSPSAFRPRRDGSRTCLESIIAFPVEGAGPVGKLSKFTQADITSGLPEDSRDADERELAKREAQRKGRVATAMKALEGHHESRELVFHDQTKLTLFCARFGIAPSEICPCQEDLSARVVAPGTPRDGMCVWCHSWHGWKPRGEVEDLQEVLVSPYDRLSEVRAREAAVLPYDPEGDGAGRGFGRGFARA